MSLFRRYAGGLAGLVAMLALVACGAGPGSPKVEPVGFKNIELKQGSTSEISLVNTFSGSELTYKATSNKPAVATVTVDNDKPALTVTAVGPGTATITVTATNSKGSAPQSFTVTVVKPAPPTSEPDPPADDPGDDPADDDDEESDPPEVKAGAETTVTFEAGGSTTETIALSTVFEGEDLTYSPTSDDNTVAIATISGGNLIIAAVGPGEATITIVATNDAGDAEHEITVTVTAPATTPPPPTSTPQETCTFSGTSLTITVFPNTSKKCTLPANHSLIYDDSSQKVSVHGPVEGNVWTITALKKGVSVVKINNDQTGGTAGTITVIVPNTPPRLTDLNPVGTGSGDAVESLLPSHTPGEDFAYVTNTLNPGASFVDVDPADIDPADGNNQGLFRFKVHDKPDGVVIDIDRGYVAVGPDDADADTPLADFNRDLNSGEFTMRAVILKNPNPGKTFDILLNAYDGSNDVSDNPVRLRFNAQDPQSGSYDVAKDDAGKFKRLRIGNRIGADQTISFGTGGFDFVTDTDVEAKLGRQILTTGDTTDHTLATTACSPVTGPSATWKDVEANLGVGCFSAKSNTSDVEIVRLDPTATDGPEVVVRLDPDHRSLSETSGATITIRYHVVALSLPLPVDGPDGQPQDVTTTTAAGKTRKVDARWYKTLSLDIHKCTDTTDCP